MLRDSVLLLGDGRKLAYSEWGAAGGAPLFHFHGIPGSRLEAWGGDAPYVSAGAHLITVDRPGIGRSDRKPGRRLLDWPDDVAAIADALGLDRFAIMAHSAGGAYALACGYALRERVTRIALVGGVPALDRPEGREQMGTARWWKLAANMPSLMWPSYALAIQAMRRAPKIGHRLLLARAPEVDRATLGRPEAARRFRQSIIEAARPGVKGLVEDMAVLTRTWGFRAADIDIETLLWQGADDHHVPARVATAYAKALPRGRATLFEGEGHFSLPEKHAAEIALTMIGNR